MNFVCDVSCGRFFRGFLLRLLFRRLDWLRHGLRRLYWHGLELSRLHWLRYGLRRWHWCRHLNRNTNLRIVIYHRISNCYVLLVTHLRISSTMRLRATYWCWSSRARNLNFAFGGNKGTLVVRLELLGSGSGGSWCEVVLINVLVGVRTLYLLLNLGGALLGSKHIIHKVCWLVLLLNASCWHLLTLWHPMNNQSWRLTNNRYRHLHHRERISPKSRFVPDTQLVMIGDGEKLSFKARRKERSIFGGAIWHVKHMRFGVLRWSLHLKIDKDLLITRTSLRCRICYFVCNFCHVIWLDFKSSD